MRCFPGEKTDGEDALAWEPAARGGLPAVGRSPYSAAVAAVVSLIATAARSEEESKSVGDLSLSRKAGARLQQWEALKRHLEAERFRRTPAAPVVNPNAILPTDEGIVEGEGTDYVVGQMDNRT